MKIRSLIFLIVLVTTFNLSAQISESQYQQIDSLFIDWNKPNHPGGAIGIVQNGKTVFSKAYGLASLEYLVPNATGTLFNIGSVSKQFTAMGIVLLHQQGKLSVDDDIRKYLPELPQFSHTISIRHMLHHTSGLRSLHAMLALAGWRVDDSRTNEDLNRFMKNQRDLNFKPGDEYLYCNTGYMLMVDIIEKVTQEKFTDWIKKSIFEQLGMIDTYAEDNYSRVVPNNATSYSRGRNNEFERNVEFWGYIGSGNMHSTTGDILKWLANFYNPQPGWEARFKMLQTLDKFNNGEENTYAFGISTWEFNGIKGIGHGGGIGGFSARMCVYPAEKLSIVILTNFSSSSAGRKERLITELLLENVATEEDEPLNNSTKTVTLSNIELAKYEGSFWNDKDNYARKIYLKKDTLRYYRSENSESPIVPIGENEFQMLNVTVDLKVKFEISGEKKTMIVTIDDGEPIISQGFEVVDLSKNEIALYTGRFYSYELETTYDIYLKGDTLSYHHARHGDSEMNILKKDVFRGQWPFRIVKYKRNTEDKIMGIFVSNGRVRNLWFEKQE